MTASPNKAAIDIEGLTIGDAFAQAVARFGAAPFLEVPPQQDRAYLPAGLRWTYADVAAEVQALEGRLTNAGYGHGHRIAVLTGNHPITLIIKLACARLGVSWVPINPDYRPAEIAYLLDDSAAALTFATPPFAPALTAGIDAAKRPVAMVTLADSVAALDATLPRAATPAPHADTPVGGKSEASLIYTSGTTGKPKGCRMGHAYALAMGAWYANLGGRLALSVGGERLYNPLPLFHVNAGILSLFCMMLTGNALIIPERFSRRRWWADIAHANATCVHYLGIIVPALMNEPAGPHDRQHRIKFGLGGGVEPTLHRAFEDRFAFPLVEIWGMTEACRLLADHIEPRHVGTRAIGHPHPTLQVRVVDDADRDVPPGTPGEMLVRYDATTPRKDHFLGYLNQDEATEHAWRGGWFHTGDAVRQDENGLITFVERKKNIIRRSGENIAAAEVEACLQAHPDVAQVAVIAVPDALRDEEVMACVMRRSRASDDDRAPAQDESDAALAQRLVAHALEHLAYYKAPGWIVFLDTLPITGTQKVLKHAIFPDGADPCTLETAHDLRAHKKRQA
ncbi:MAG: AMP-binding protein [Pseudomonadota bacterium]